MYLGNFLFGLALALALCPGLDWSWLDVRVPLRCHRDHRIHHPNTPHSWREHSLIVHPIPPSHTVQLRQNCGSQTDCCPSPQPDITHYCCTRARTGLKHGYQVVNTDEAGRILFRDILRASSFFHTISSTCELLFLFHCILLASVRIDHGAGADAGQRGCEEWSAFSRFSMYLF